jgi:hypothetical protein
MLLLAGKKPEAIIESAKLARQKFGKAIINKACRTKCTIYI